MQQPPYGHPPPTGGSPPTAGYGHSGPSLQAKKPNVVLIAAIGGGGLVIVVALALLVRSAAHRQEADCAAAVQQASGAIGKGDDAAGRGALQSARAACKSLRATELAALEAVLNKRQQDAKAVATRPALLAAGFKPEQFTRATIAPVCKDRMPVEMVASQVQGEPHYWDCDQAVLYQIAPQTPQTCDARKLEFTTTTDENGKSVGACKTSAESVDEDRLRKACKVAGTAKIQKAGEVEVKVMCQKAIERLLKSPKSAEFPGVFDDDGKPVSTDGCTTVYSSYVDAQNAFGAKLRTKYVGTYDPRTGLATPRVL